jgi:hypothetical protein
MITDLSGTLATASPFFGGQESRNSFATDKHRFGKPGRCFASVTARMDPIESRNRGNGFSEIEGVK